MPERDPDNLDEAVELAKLLKAYQECDAPVNSKAHCSQKKCPVHKLTEELGYYNCPYDEEDLFDNYFRKVIRKLTEDINKFLLA